MSAISESLPPPTAGRMLPEITNSKAIFLSCAASVLLWVFYRLVIYPRFLSPLRHIPGPPLGNPVFGTIPAIFRGKPGEPHNQWIRDHGPVVRDVGPLGIERLTFSSPNALQKIFVSSWLDYPRVSCCHLPCVTTLRKACAA